jgi:hypothetical protein
MVPRMMGSLLREVNLTEARNLSPLFDDAVRQDHPVMIVRNRKECGVLLARDTVLRVLSSYTFHVDVLPEADGSFTLWINELEVGGHGPTLRDAREDLLGAVRSFVGDYLVQFDFYRHLPDRARLEPYVLRLSLARNDEELRGLIFPPPPKDVSSTVSQTVA